MLQLWQDRPHVLEERCLEGQAVAIQCAHGDVALYPLAEVELEVEGTRVQQQFQITYQFQSFLELMCWS